MDTRLNAVLIYKGKYFTPSTRVWTGHFTFSQTCSYPKTQCLAFPLWYWGTQCFEA